MTLSVLISVYKAETPTCLDLALGSVMEDQTHKPDKVVIVEDGALTDELYDVVDKWEKAFNGKTVIIKNEVNLGLTKSLNIGLRHCDTDLIARMDSDDISCPDRFEKQIAFFEEHPEIDILGGAILEIDEDGTPLNERYYPLDSEGVCCSIHKANPIVHPTVMIRRKIFDNGLRYDERYKTNQDLALWFDAIIAGYKFANLPDIVLHFRRQASVYKRRKKIKNLLREFRIYCSGIKRLYGILSWRYIYPFSRLCLKLMPVCVVKWAYRSHLRSAITQNNRKTQKQ